PVKVTEEQLDAIKQRLDRLEQVVSSLRRRGVRDPVLADIEVYLKAAEWMRSHGEFYGPKYADWTLEAIDRGLLRAGQAGMNDPAWYREMGNPVVRGYRSQIDGSVQP